MSMEQRIAFFKVWSGYRKGIVQSMVCTTAFGCGVDNAKFRLVVHLHGSFSLLDFAQESGRAGRDGSPCTSLVLRQSGRRPMQAQRKAFGKFINFLDTNICRRVILESFMDGQNRYRCSPGEAQFDICLKTNEVEKHMAFCELTTKTYIVTPTNTLLRLDTRRIAQCSEMAGKLSLYPCPVCLFTKESSGIEIKDHSFCFKQRCFTCMQSPCSPTHDFKKCAIITRGTNRDHRCYECGMARELEIHERESCGNMETCPFKFVKKALLYMWRDETNKQKMFDFLRVKQTSILALGNFLLHYSFCYFLTTANLPESNASGPFCAHSTNSCVFH